MNKKNLLYMIIITLFAVSVVLGILIVLKQQNKKASVIYTKYKDKIAVVEINDTIFFTSSSESFIKKDAEYYVGKLTSYFKRKDVKGIVLKINSPGGSVAAVQRLYRQIRKLKEEYKKPIVCYVPELCVSGGYYVACACDKIICSEGSVLGSVGVILQVGNISELLKKIGVSVEVIKSSKYKDIGSFYRSMTPEEKQIFETLVNTAYEQFIQAIIEGRGLSRVQVMNFADGRVFIGPQAVDLLMADIVGDEEDAINEVKRIAGIKGEVEVIREKVKPLDFLYNIVSEKYNNLDILSKVDNSKFLFGYIFE